MGSADHRQGVQASAACGMEDGLNKQQKKRGEKVGMTTIFARAASQHPPLVHLHSTIPVPILSGGAQALRTGDRCCPHRSTATHRPHWLHCHIDRHTPPTPSTPAPLSQPIMPPIRHHEVSTGVLGSPGMRSCVGGDDSGCGRIGRGRGNPYRVRTSAASSRGWTHGTAAVPSGCFPATGCSERR